MVLWSIHINNVMTLPSLGTASCCGQREVVNSLEEIISSWPHSIETEWSFIENKEISSTSQNLRSEQHLCSGESIKDRWRIQLRTGQFVTIWGSSWETVWPHYHNAVYIIAADMRFTSNCCIRWMSEDDTVVKLCNVILDCLMKETTIPFGV